MATGKSGGIIGKSGEFRGNSGEIWGKLGKNWGQNSLVGKSISPTWGKEVENEGKLFHKNSHLGNVYETAGGSEREFRFHHKFQLHSTVYVMCTAGDHTLNTSYSATIIEKCLLVLILPCEHHFHASQFNY